MTDDHDEITERKQGKIMGGMIVLGIGVFFLLVNTGILPRIRVTWPLILIIVGLALLINALTDRKKRPL